MKRKNRIVDEDEDEDGRVKRLGNEGVFGERKRAANDSETTKRETGVSTAAAVEMVEDGAGREKDADDSKERGI